MAGLGLALLSAHTIEAEIAGGRLGGSRRRRACRCCGNGSSSAAPIVRRRAIAQAMWDFAVAEAPKLMPNGIAA